MPVKLKNTQGSFYAPYINFHSFYIHSREATKITIIVSGARKKKKKHERKKTQQHSTPQDEGQKQEERLSHSKGEAALQKRRNKPDYK